MNTPKPADTSEGSAQTAEDVVMELSLACYQREAVLAATYALANRCTVEILPGGHENSLEVRLRPTSAEAHRDLAQQFHQELIDHQLRLDLEHRFGQLRDLIYRQAFAPLQGTSDPPKVWLRRVHTACCRYGSGASRMGKS